MVFTRRPHLGSQPGVELTFPEARSGQAAEARILGANRGRSGDPRRLVEQRPGSASPSADVQPYMFVGLRRSLASVPSPWFVTYVLGPLSPGNQAHPRP